MDDDAQTAAPVADETQTQETETVETVQPEQQEVAEVPEQTEQTNEGAEAPEPVEEPEEEPYNQVDYSQYLPQNNQIPVADDGTVDPYEFKQQLKEEMRAEIRFEQQEARAWQQVDKKYPGLSQEDRETIKDLRIAEALQGKAGNLSKIADRIMKGRSAAKSEGRAEAQTSRKVQKAASLETTTANTGNDTKNDTLDRIGRGDNVAAEDLMSDWLDKGLI